MKALQDKKDSLERQLQQRGNGTNGTVQSSARPDVVCYTCSEAGHFSRDCAQKQQGRRNGQFNKGLKGVITDVVFPILRIAVIIRHIRGWGLTPLSR